MREAVVVYDKKGKEIWACANVDARGTEEIVKLISEHPGLEEKLYQKTGQGFALDAIPRLLWLKDKIPEIYNQMHKFGMLNDWILYHLTDVLAVEPSNGSTSGLFDLKTRTWDKEIFEVCGLRTDIFPDSIECGQTIGQVSEQASSETGLPIGIPVVVGGGGAQLGCVGVGAIRSNQSTLLGGSFWQFERNMDKPIIDELCRLRINCHAVPDLWQYEAIAFQPGLVMRWYIDSFCQYEELLAKEQRTSVYKILDEKAEQIPVGSYGIVCTFSDIMNYLHWEHAAPAFLNFPINTKESNTSTFYRAIMENAAYVSNGNRFLVEEVTGVKTKEIIFAGGSAQSSLWCQIISDVMGLPVLVPKVTEATALGAAILAGCGVGLYSNLESAVDSIVIHRKKYEPNTENYFIYKNYFNKWKKIYSHQLELVHEKLVTTMWSAPGI